MSETTETTTTPTKSPEVVQIEQDFARACTALGNALFQVEILKQDQAAINTRYRELVLSAQAAKTETPATN